MTLPKSSKIYRRSGGDIPQTLRLKTEDLPSTLKADEVLIRIHAVSLNYRDVAMLHGKYPAEILEKGVPVSDCAAEVISVGSEVHDFKAGDYVGSIFDLNNLTGMEDKSAALGGEVEGVLREYAVFNQDVLLHLPKYLSWEEAACIPCAGVTAWNALNMPRTSGTALLLGTGGVSMFALLICLAAGIRPIITSSSDEKLDALKAFGSEGSIDTINYRKFPDWEKEVLRLTNGRGVDVVIENGGPSTADKSLASISRRGVVSLVGFLGGFNVEAQPNLLLPTLQKTARIQGIAVGSKIDQRNLCDFLSEKKVALKGIIDKRVFSFEESQAAFDYLYSGQHVGKVIIKL
ncbi:hypothetical protein VI817_008064 [Penicillium citrinum]|nr:hypothetical protein VI817_008064 [Penicillium citrinum]